MYFLHTEDVRLGIEHALSIDDISAAYPLLDVIDHDKSRAAVSIICVAYCALISRKVVPYSITSVGHGADPGFLAVSPQVT